MCHAMLPGILPCLVLIGKTVQLEPAWKTLHFNKVGKTDLETDEKRLNNW